MNDRITAMRQIEGSLGGWARLYGTKDLAQFAQQVAFMLDYEDNYSKCDIAFNDMMPTYNDMTDEQLRHYFSWRSRVRKGQQEEAPQAFALLYLFEQMNQPNNAAQLAQAWLQLREHHPRLDQCMPIWFKDYCLCYQLNFWAQVDTHNLSAFFPAPRSDNLADIASYNCREGRFFRERPELLPLFERILDALPRNLEPLLAFYNLSPREIFYPQPARFSHYELFKGAAVFAPERSGSFETKLSHSEVYRCNNGKWSHANNSAFRPPSHAAGWLVKRAEGLLRSRENYLAPWNDPEAHALLERWLHEPGNSGVFRLIEDPRLFAIISETVQAMHKEQLSEGELVPAAAKLAAQLQQEPYKTVRAMQRRPRFAQYNMEQLRAYLSWREDLQAGKPRLINTELALLHMDKCDTDALCRFLRDYGSFDKTVARRLQERIPNEPELLRRWQLEAWFPAAFLFTETDQFTVFLHLSSYKMAKSRFYRKGPPERFRACFEHVLAAANRVLDLPAAMLHKGELTPRAQPIATFLLKRMEQRLRELAGFPYAITADPTRFGCTEELACAIDQAVEESGIRIQVSAARHVPQAKEEAPPPVEPPPPVTVDFTQLQRIREQANELTELLIVDEEDTVRAEPEVKIDMSGLSLREALSQEQAALIDSIIAGNTADELAVETINEIALDIIGDVIIEENQVVEAYIEAWKEGML